MFKKVVPLEVIVNPVNTLNEIDQSISAPEARALATTYNNIKKDMSLLFSQIKQCANIGNYYIRLNNIDNTKIQILRNMGYKVERNIDYQWCISW